MPQSTPASSPPGAVSNATLFENAFYVGISLQNILYGIELFLYFKTMRTFLRRRRRPHKFDAFYAGFSTVMFLMVTIWISVTALLGQRMWLLDRTYPGGPMAYVTQGALKFWRFTASVTIILQQMTDGLMVYRCRIVWDSLRIIIIPSFLWVSTLVMGVVSAAMTGHDPFIGVSQQLTFAYFTCSVFLSTTLTCMICYRLLYQARKMKECLGGEYASPYFTIVTLLVESVLPYTFSGIIFLVLTGIRNPTGIAFSLVYTMMMCISPQMLILRVAEGIAWQTDMTLPTASRMVFCQGRGGDTSESSPSDGSEAVEKHLEPSGIY